MDPAAELRDVERALAVPFEDAEVKWKPQAVKGNRALAIAYVDVRVVMDRLDAVVGCFGWQDEYTVLPGDQVMCRLTVTAGGRTVTKADVGGESEQPDDGDKRKAAFSDALKRTAVKFGIGRYLYRLPHQWADYDPAKKQFATPPKLPDWARAKAGPAKGRPAASANGQPKPATLPATGAELHKRLREADADLAAKGLAPVGGLLAHVTQAGVKAGYGADMRTWEGAGIELAVAETRAFKAGLAKKPQQGGARR